MTELHGLFRVEHPYRLVARSRATHEMLERFPDGVLVNGRIDKPRNPKFNALAHALFAKIADAKGCSTDTLKMYLKAATGRADLVKLPDGRLALHGHPMDFGSMGEQEFRQFWDEALVFLFAEVVPGLPRALQDEIERMVIREA